jgi:CD36 family
MQELECCAYGPCGDKGTQGLTPAIKPWMTTDAETIRGAFGEQFHQFIDPTESLYVSTHDFGILRAWKLTNKGSGPAGSGTDIAGTGANGGSAGDTLEVKGITLLKFTYADGTMGNFSVNEEEAFAYNNYGPSGLLNQSLCEWGAKIFISQPRFYGGSQSLRDGVIGLGPATQDVGESFLGVEPFTGSTFQFSWRVQINALLEPTLLPGAPVPLFFPNVNPVFMPIAWASRYGEVNDNEASEFKSSVYLARDLMVSARWGGAGLACIALIAGIVFLMLGARRRRDQQHMREISAAAFYASNAGAGLDSSVYTPFLPPPGYSNGGGGDVGLSPISDVMLMQGPHGPTQQLGVAGGLNVGALPPGVNVNRSINSTGGVGVAGVQAFAGGGFFSPSHAANGPSNIAGGDVWEEEEVVAEGDLMAMHQATTSYEEAGNGGGGGAMSTASSFDASNTSPFPVVRQQPQQTRGGGYSRIPPNAVDMLPPDSPAQQGPKTGRSGNSGAARGSFDVDASGTQQRAQAANAARTWSATAGHY